MMKYGFYARITTMSGLVEFMDKLNSMGYTAVDGSSLICDEYLTMAKMYWKLNKVLFIVMDTDGIQCTTFRKNTFTRKVKLANGIIG